jgi:uncharacterized protein
VDEDAAGQEPASQGAASRGAGEEPAAGRGEISFAGRAFELARTGDAGALSAYLDGGVPANLANEHGDTLLMLAAYHGHEGVVRALLARGADPGQANDKGQTPLAGAVFKQQPGIVRALLDAGADPHAGTPSAVQAARMFGAYKFLDWFGEGPRF